MNKRSTTNKILIGVTAILFVITAAIGVYFGFFANSKTVFQKTIDGAFKQISSTLSSVSANHKTLKGSSNLTYKINTTDESIKQVADLINNFNVNIGYEIDMNSKYMSYDIDTKYKGQDLLNINANMTNNKLYILLKDVYDKYLYMDMDELSDLFNEENTQELNKQINNLNTVLNSLNREINNALKDIKIEKKSEKVTVNNQTQEVTKNYIALNEKELSEMVVKIEKNLYNDAEFKKALSELYGVDQNELTNKWNTETSTSTNTDTIYTISIYTSGSNLAGFEFDVTEKNENLMNAKVLVKDNVYDFSIKADNETNLTGTLKIDYKESNNKVEFNEELTLNVSELGSVELNTKNTFEYDVNIEKKNVENSINYETLTEEQTNEILSKLQSRQGVTEFMKDFEVILESISSSISDPYDEQNPNYNTDYNYDDSSDL